VNHFELRYKPLRTLFSIDSPKRPEAILLRAWSFRVSGLEYLIVKDN